MSVPYGKEALDSYYNDILTDEHERPIEVFTHVQFSIEIDRSSVKSLTAVDMGGTTHKWDENKNMWSLVIS